MSHGDYKDFFRGACDGDLELVRHHLRRSVDVDFIHPELLSTALVAAIEAGGAEVALVLLEHGADPALRSPWREWRPWRPPKRQGWTTWPRGCATPLGGPPTTPQVADRGLPHPRSRNAVMYRDRVLLPRY